MTGIRSNKINGMLIDIAKIADKTPSNERRTCFNVSGILYSTYSMSLLNLLRILPTEKFKF